MTDKTNEPMTILAENIANDGTFGMIQDEISEAVSNMNNSQDTRDRLDLETGDELPEPIVLGVVVAFGDEASIIWRDVIDTEEAVIAADYTQDVLADAKTAYSKATARLRDKGETRSDRQQGITLAMDLAVEGMPRKTVDQIRREAKAKISEWFNSQIDENKP